MKKRVLSIVLAVIMVVTMLPASIFAVAPTYDDTQDHWAEEAINRWSEYSVVQGKGDGVFDPEGLMSRAEAAQVFANLLGLNKVADISEFKDVKDAWYKTAIAKCYAAGILNGKGNGIMDPDGKITREEFMAMYARAICISNREEPEAAKTELTKKGYKDASKVSAWAADSISILVDKGYVKGTTETTLAPQDIINRASVMSLLNNSISTYIGKDSKDTSVAAKSEGITLIASTSVTKVTGNADVVVVAAGAEKYDETTGEIEHSDIKVESAKMPIARVEGENITVTLTINTEADDAEVTVTGVDSEIIVESTASAKSVTLSAEGSKATVAGKVETVKVEETAKAAVVDTKTTAKVETVENKASDTTVKGTGTVTEVKSSENIIIETKSTKVENTNEEKQIAVTDSKGKEIKVETKTESSSTETSSTETIVNKEEEPPVEPYYPPAPAHTPVDVPTAVTGLTYNGAGQTGVAEDTGYTVTDNKAIDAGAYTATATLVSGYKWSDGTTNAKQIEWSIAKAVLTATADDKNVTVGDAIPVYTVTYTGWVNGESIDTVTPTTASELTCEYTAESSAGEYGITFTTEPEFANYSVTTVPGTLTATAPAATYTVTFDLNGIDGTAPEAKTITSGEKVTKPADPTDEIHTFAGWYKTKDATTGELSNQWNFDTNKVTENITLYAQWTRTLKSILDTNNNVPQSTDDNPPDNAWVNGSNPNAKAYIGVYNSENRFYFRGAGTNGYYFYMNDEFTKTGNNYIRVEEKVKATCYMKNTTFASVNFVAINQGYELYNGTYVPADATFKAVYDTTDGKNTLTFYYDALAHSGQNSTVYKNENGTNNYLFDDEKSNNQKWGYYGISSNVKSVAIDSSVANYTGLTSTAYMLFGIENANNITGAEYLDVSNVTDMSYMFAYFGKSSQTINVVPDVSGWNTAKVEKINDVFSSYGYGSEALNAVPNVSGWNTAKVTTMTRLFDSYGYSSTVLDKVPDVNGSNWDTSKVTNMSNVFNSYGYSSKKLNVVPNVSNWETDNVTKMNFLFSKYGYSSEALNAVPDVSEWDTSSVSDMSKIFEYYGYSSTALTSAPNVSKWTTLAVTKTGALFAEYGYTSTELKFTLNLSGWIVTNITDCTSMFNNAGANAATWTVIIPAKTDEKDNDATHWYVVDGTDTEKFIMPATDKRFTLATPTTYTVTFEPEKEGDVEIGAVRNSKGQKVTEITVPSGTTISVSGNTITIGENTFTAVENDDRHEFNSFSPSSGTITGATTIKVNFSEKQP